MSVAEGLGHEGEIGSRRGRETMNEHENDARMPEEVDELSIFERAERGPFETGVTWWWTSPESRSST